MISDTDRVSETPEEEQGNAAVTDSPVVSALIPPYVERDSPREMRLWRLRCAERALKFARGVLQEGGEVALRGEAHPRVEHFLKQASVATDRALGRLQKQLRQLRNPRVHQWVSWSCNGEDPKVLHGEARTLAEAKEGALQALRQIEGSGFYGRFSDRDAVALVIGPLGARFELRRTYSRQGSYLGFRWQKRLRERIDAPSGFR